MTISLSTWTFSQVFLARARRRVLSLLFLIRSNRVVHNSSSSVASWDCSNNVIMAGSKEIHNYLEVAKKLAVEGGEVIKKCQTYDQILSIVLICQKDFISTG